MNKTKKILIFVTCFCFAFVFLFSINFARSNIVKADYNLVNVADLTETLGGGSLYKDRKLMDIKFSGTFTLSYDTEKISGGTPSNIGVGYGIGGYSYDIGYPTFNISGKQSVTFTITEAMLGQELYVRYIRFNSATASSYRISNIVLHFADDSLGSAYEQGFINGTHFPILPEIDDDFYAYNLISVPDHTAITVNQFFDEYKTSFSFEPNVTYIFSLRFDVTNTTASGLKFIVGYGDSFYFVEQLGVGFMTGSPNDTVMFSFTTPEVFQIPTPYLWLREIDASELHTTTAYISDIFLRYYSEYEYGHSVGYSNGYSDGSREGYNAGASGTITTNWFTSFLSSTFDILNIEVFPNIKLIYLIFIPVGLGVLALILKMARG